MTGDQTGVILLVDKEQAQINKQKEFLDELGLREIVTAADGTEAWYRVKSFNVGLIMCSWELPDMTGLVFLRILRADSAYEDIPVVLIAEKVTKKEVVEAGAAGVSGVMTRPLEKDKYNAKVNSLLKVEVDPKDVEFQKGYDFGLELIRKGSYNEARQQFKKLLNVYETAEIYYNLGYIKTTQGKYEEALIAFRRATQINSAYAKAYKKMAEVYSLLGRDEEAQKCLEAAAEIYLEKQMDSEAESVLLEALTINPNTINIYNTLGIVYRRQGNYQESIRYYRKALKVTPEDENIMFNLARVYLAAKSFREARLTLLKALDLNPNFSEAKKMLDSLSMGAGLE